MADVWDQRSWEEQQLDEARITGETRVAVRRLLDAWTASTGEYKVDRDIALDAFKRLSAGQHLVTPDKPDERWATVNAAGQIHMRDTVRVRFDAYSDDAGRMHNGRRGRVVAVRYGDVVVRYEDGRQPPFDAVHHPPAKLEKLL